MSAEEIGKFFDKSGKTLGTVWKVAVWPIILAAVWAANMYLKDNFVSKTDFAKMSEYQANDAEKKAVKIDVNFEKLSGKIDVLLLTNSGNNVKIEENSTRLSNLEARFDKLTDRLATPSPQNSH